MEPDSSRENNDRARGNEHKLEHKIVWLGKKKIKKNSLLGMYCKSLPREVVECPSLKVTQNLTEQGPEQQDLSSPCFEHRVGLLKVIPI